MINGFGDKIKRLVSPKAKAAHAQQKADFQKRMDSAKARVQARKVKDAADAKVLLNQIQDEVLLKTKHSMPSVPHYPGKRYDLPKLP
jgi:hypothetical protein